MKLFTSLARTLPLLPLVLATGCPAPDSPAPAEAVASEAEPLLGAVSYAGNCTAPQRTFLDRVMVYGRVAAASPAFAACVSAAIKGTTLNVPIAGTNVPRYRECKGDPFYGKSNTKKLNGILKMAKSANDVSMDCANGTTGNASAPLGTYGHAGEEAFSWTGPVQGVDGWLARAVGRLTQPICGTPGATADCRLAAYPWPYSKAAATVWHEASHTHGYGHGHNSDNQAAKEACGYKNDATWNFQTNTMPYILGWCVSSVIAQSAATCGGDLALGCAGDSMRMVDSLAGATCSCVSDPRASLPGVGHTVPRQALPVGSVESASVSTVTGWVVDSDHPDEPLSVYVYIDDQYAASGTANQFSAGRGMHGFSVPVDIMARGYGAHKVEVIAFDLDLRPGGQKLANSPRTVRVTSQPAEGFIDEATPELIRGWAIDADFEGAVNVHFYIDGQGVGSTWADIYRPDVGSHSYAFDPPPLGPGIHRVEAYAIGMNQLGEPTNENPLLHGSPSYYYEADFWKPGNNGTASCDVFCEGAAWGEVGGCITAVRSDNSERLSCSVAPGLLDGQLTCGCERGFIKPGNNGTVSCDTFCDGAVWGRRGRCVGANRSDTGAQLTCDDVPGLLPGQLTCQCVPKIVLE